MSKYFLTIALVTAGFLLPVTARADTNKTLGSLDTPGQAQDVVVIGNYAYVADGTLGVTIVNVANPAAPSLVGSTDTPGSADRLDTANQYLYVADSLSLRILDLTAPTAPTLAGSIDALTAGITIDDVATDGTYAYLLGTADGTTHKLVVFDVSIPGTPVLKSSVVVPGRSDVTLAGNYAYVVGGNTLTIVNDYPILTVAGSYTDPSASAAYQSVQLFGSNAYINDSALGMHALNIGNPAAVTSVFDSSSLFPSTGYGTGLAISNGFAFLPKSIGGVAIYDVATTTIPSYVDTYAGVPTGQGITIANDVAIVTNGDAGVQFLDVSHPDTVPPDGKLVGDINPVVPPGGTYQDPGITVVGGTVKQVDGKVDTTKVGKYILTYTITDRVGNTTTVKRTVIVGPSIEKVKLVNNTLTIKVGTKNVTLKPFPGYRGALIARKAIVDTKKNPFYFFIPTDARAKPELVIYNYQGKQVVRVDLTTISTKGLQVDLVPNPMTLSIFMAVAPKVNGLTASIFNLSKGGYKALGRVTAAAGKGTLVMKFLKTYTQEYGFVTLVKNTTKKPVVWRYNSTKKVFLKDAKFDLTKLVWTKTSVRLK